MITTINPADYPGGLMLPREVARLFRVDTKTVNRWSDTGKLAAIRTPGNQRRFRVQDVQALLNAGQK